MARPLCMFLKFANFPIHLTKRGIDFYVADAAGWVASTADDNQYLEVDLKVIHNVTKVIIQGSGKAVNAWTKQFKV